MSARPSIRPQKNFLFKRLNEIWYVGIDDSMSVIPKIILSLCYTTVCHMTRSNARSRSRRKMADFNVYLLRQYARNQKTNGEF